MNNHTMMEDPLPFCPCLDDNDRFLQEDNNNNTNTTTIDDESEGEEEIVLWEVIYTCLVLFLMFVALISDRMGADMVMLGALTLCMCSGIITIAEGLVGFANEGILTVLVLFVVADGISKTGALDWYMSKLLGRPDSLAAAQLRLMIPIAVVSAFLNNTPVVAVMIPIVQKWGKNIGISPAKLLIPLSFASILGGTCTLIGTSTNLVVSGLLTDRYPDDPDVVIGLFDLGEYGVPIAIAGVSYILLLSPCLLPGGTCCNSNKNSTGASGGNLPLDNHEDVLLGAKVTAWSPAAGRSVKRSGLRDTGGIYLVSVYRAATGNVHRAVGQEFVLNVGDILYFTGLIDSFGQFCEEHGLEVFTQEVEQSERNFPTTNPAAGAATSTATTSPNGVGKEETDSLMVLAKQLDDLGETGGVDVEENRNDMGVGEKIKNSLLSSSRLENNNEEQPKLISINFELTSIRETGEDSEENLACEIGLTKESICRANETDRMRTITRMTDLIRHQPRTEPTSDEKIMIPRRTSQREFLLNRADPSQIVVTIDHSLVVVGVNARDRAGLLLDISKGLLRMNLQLRHTEASVVYERSISIWRCETIGVELPDIEEIWTVLNALLEAESGVEAVKKRGLRVIRVRVTEFSSLIGRTATEVDFRTKYEAAIVAVQQGGKNVNQSLSTVRFDADDVLILQATENSPVVVTPPEDFYKKLAEEKHHKLFPTPLLPRRNSKTDLQKNATQAIAKLVKGIKRTNSSSDISTIGSEGQNTDNDQPQKKQGSTGNRRTMSLPDLTKVGSGGDDNDDLKNSSSNLSGKDSNNAQAMRAFSGDSEEGGIFFVGELDENKTGTEVADAVDESARDTDKEISRNEEVWKDLQVLSSEGDNNDGENGVSREFLTAMTVAPNSQLAGKSAAGLGINKLVGVVLVTIERPSSPRGSENDAIGAGTRKSMLTVSYANADLASLGDELSSIRSTAVEQTFTTITQDDPLAEGDILWFAGSASSVGDLRKIPGLLSYQNEEVEKIGEKVFDRRLVQAVVAKGGPLVGKTVKELQFRTRYGAAVIAIHRNGNRIHDHPGKVKLQSGDVLLLEAGSTFIARSSENDKSFALLAEVKDSAPPRLRMYVPALIITAIMLIVVAVGLVSLLLSALVASMLMIALGIISEQEARDAVHWDVFITIASAFGIGTTMVNSGVAAALAGFLVNVGYALNIGDAGLFAAVYLATFLISNVVTNNAAAALLFPIAMDAAEDFGTDVKLMSYCLMLAASASFMSPFGYTTNIMIYGPGGYKYNDFVIIGTPMQIVLWIFSVLFLSREAWWPSYVGTLGIFVVIVAFTVFKDRCCKKPKALHHDGEEEKES